jgi:hypothetical protein
MKCLVVATVFLAGMLVAGTSLAATCPVCDWFNETFDNCPLGCVDQCGWTTVPGRYCAQVVCSDPCDQYCERKEVELDAPADSIQNTKPTIRVVESGKHTFSFVVQVNDPLYQQNIARINVIGGSHYRFLVHFGTKIWLRAFYNPYEAQDFDLVKKENLEPGRRYRITLYLDLDHTPHQVIERVVIDGIEVNGVQNVSIGRDPIDMVTLSGWDRNGNVHIDEICGHTVLQ